MSKEQREHPLARYPENEQIAYLSILSAICYVDNEFADEEKRQLDTLLKELRISDAGKAMVYASIFDLQRKDQPANLEMVQSLCNTELKYTLISDLYLFALSDAEFTDEENQYILEIGRILGVTQEQMDAIRSVQENLVKIKDIPPNSKKVKRILKDSVAKLVGTGVPIAAIAAGGSVTGLSAAGITSGLAALGALVGGGMLAGTVIVVPALAVGSAYGAKKLLNVVWKDDSEGDATKKKR